MYQRCFCLCKGEQTAALLLSAVFVCIMKDFYCGVATCLASLQAFTKQIQSVLTFDFMQRIGELGFLYVKYPGP